MVRLAVSCRFMAVALALPFLRAVMLGCRLEFAVAANVVHCELWKVGVGGVGFVDVNGGL